jgi:hypothetical protein
VAADRRRLSQPTVDRIEGEMIVASHQFHAIDATSLQDRCSYRQPHDVQGSFLQRCAATLSLHCNPLPLGRGAATIRQPYPSVSLAVITCEPNRSASRWRLCRLRVQGSAPGPGEPCAPGMTTYGWNSQQMIREAINRDRNWDQIKRLDTNE